MIPSLLPRHRLRRTLHRRRRCHCSRGYHRARSRSSRRLCPRCLLWASYRPRPRPRRTRTGQRLPRPLHGHRRRRGHRHHRGLQPLARHRRTPSHQLKQGTRLRRQEQQQRHSHRCRRRSFHLLPPPRTSRHLPRARKGATSAPGRHGALAWSAAHQANASSAVYASLLRTRVGENDSVENCSAASGRACPPTRARVW
jgi:hypothetical protein